MCRLRSDSQKPAVPPRRMDFRLIEKVIAEQKNHGLAEVIPSTMGEPLLYPEMDRLIDLCSGTGIRLNLTTNGTFPGRGARAWAQRLVPVVSDVKISWNGATAATAAALMSGLHFESALRAAKDFIEVRDAEAAAGASRCRVSFQVTATERNVAELPAIVDLAASLGVDRVKVNHLWVHFDELEPLSLRRTSEGLSRWNAAVRAARRAAVPLRRPDGQPVLLQNFVELDGDPRSPAPLGECPFLGKEAWVMVDGRFAPCPAPGAAELGDFGSVLERSLADIWGDARLAALRRRYKERSECCECRMRRPGGA
jgi:MoaA/NifB/PqqE/SkfB family radical SAM enzyme